MTGLRTIAMLVLGAALLAAGCSRGPGRAEVSGKVVVDHKPLDDGAITFFPTDGTVGPSAGGAIKNGEYHIPREQGVAIGKNRVEIRAFRNTGKKIRDLMDKSQLADERVPALAPEYNDKSTLVREVKDEPNVLDFDLPGIGSKK